MVHSPVPVPQGGTRNISVPVGIVSCRTGEGDLVSGGMVMVKDAIFMVVLLAVSNFGWQYLVGEHNWWSALERSWFQAFAILLAYTTWRV